MKKSFKVLCIMLVVFMMTGCMKFNMNMTINKDKSMDLALTVALANSMMGDTNSAIMDNSQIQQMEDNGYKVEEYSDNSMSGYTISTKIDNIDDVSTEEDTIFNINEIAEGKKLSDIFTVKKGFLKNTYTVKFGDETSDASQNENVITYENELFEDDEEMSALLNSMDINFTINLPNKALSSNTTSTSNDGKTLIWEPSINAAASENIEFEFELYNMKNIYITIGIAAIIIIIIIILIVKKRKPKAPVATPVPVNDQVVVNNQTVPVTPVVNDSPVPTPMNTDMVAQTPVEPVQDNSAQTPVEPQSNETPVQTTNEPENVTPTEPKTLDVQSETNDNSNENLTNTESTETPNIFNANPNSENK